MDATQIYNAVQEHYGLAARGSSSSTHSSTIAKAFGYTEAELANAPKEANLGLSCGNPLALAKLRENETVIDLGSGAGFDVFQASKKVGPNGKAIGVDMNKEMLQRAERNRAKVSADNVSFVESRITEISIPDATADCIISNCVVNLVPEEEKHLVFKEMFRLLKPGGRVAISDILLKRELPAELKKDIALYVGCVSGASLVKDYENYLHEAGFNDVLIVDSKHDLNVYTETNEDNAKNGCCGIEKPQSCCGKPPACCNGGETAGDKAEVVEAQPKNIDFNQWAGSFQVYAVKP